METDLIFGFVLACLGAIKAFRPRAPWWQLWAAMIWSVGRFAIDPATPGFGPTLAILAALLVRAIWSLKRDARRWRSVRRPGARYKIA